MIWQALMVMLPPPSPSPFLSFMMAPSWPQVPKCASGGLVSPGTHKGHPPCDRCSKAEARREPPRGSNGSQNIVIVINIEEPQHNSSMVANQVCPKIPLNNNTLPRRPQSPHADLAHLSLLLNAHTWIIVTQRISNYFEYSHLVLMHSSNNNHT